MTTETQEASKAENEEEQSFLPTVLAGAGILAVAALLIFWPSDDGAKGDAAGGANGKTAAANGSKNGGRGKGGRAAGVGSRSVDAATKPDGSGRRNPAIKMPAAARGMAPVPEALPEDPPASASVDDKIAFYEKRLEQAIQARDQRKKFTERLPAVQARIESSPNPEEGMQAFEKRKKLVEDNYEKAKLKVEEIEGKLAELQGG